MPLAADRRRHGARPGQAKTLVRPTTQKNRIPDEEQPKNVYFFFAEMCCSGPRSCRGVMLAKHPRPESESRPTKWITSHLRGHASSDNTYIIHVHYIHTRTSAKRQEPGTQYVGRLLGPKAAAGITQRTCSSTATLDPLKDCPAIHEVAAPRASEPGRRQLGRQAVARFLGLAGVCRGWNAGCGCGRAVVAPVAGAATALDGPRRRANFLPRCLPPRPHSRGRDLGKGKLP